MTAETGFFLLIAVMLASILIALGIYLKGFFARTA
jgi:hypothetical protein